MKVHPAPIRRNIAVCHDFSPLSTATGVICRPKKLRRLPHIFAKVIELPFYSDADVSIQETSESLRFVVDTDDDIGADIAAHTIEIYPGVTKIVIGGTRVVTVTILQRVSLSNRTRKGVIKDHSELVTDADTDQTSSVTSVVTWISNFEFQYL
ncbi:hypothetical protein E3N88_22066 [Mikania micrantha]|uniref:Uncharacterized protein n=1 Tax=Mikania micrantha TaxID=192012 RepID=A0A5N6NBX4_9ASTR|nr:hypothetical protein E3N88_22066 [Mikania micrantha]